MRGFLVAIAAMLVVGAMCADAQADPLDAFTVYSKTSLQVETSGVVNDPGTVLIDGAIGSDGNIVIFGSVTLGDIVSGSGSNGSGSITNGDIVTLGTFQLGGAGTVNGNIDAGGNVTLKSSSLVTGNVTSDGNILLESAATVGGAVSYDGILTLNGTASVGTDLGGPANPLAPMPILLPTATTITAGGSDQNVNTDRSLAPGLYGDVIIRPGRRLTLTPGRYEFDSLNATTGAIIDLDFTGGGTFEIYVKGNLTMGGGTTLNLVNGGSLEDVYTEVHGVFNQLSNATYRGSVFAPYSTINVGARSELYGTAYALGSITIKPSALVEYHLSTVLADKINPGGPVVPEPGSIALVALGVLGIFLGRRKFT